MYSRLDFIRRLYRLIVTTYRRIISKISDQHFFYFTYESYRGLQEPAGFHCELEYFAIKLFLKRSIIISILFFCIWETNAQSKIAFQHLNTTNGLSYIGVHSMCVDKKGNLWVGTGNGLNMFNGKTVEKYFATDYPQLQSSNILTVVCDVKNRIWVLTSGGFVTMIDEKRQLHRVSVYEENKWIKTLQIFNTDKYGAILYTGKGNYSLKENISFGHVDSITKNHFNFLPIKDWSKYKMKGPNKTFQLNDDYYLLIHQDAFLSVNYSNNTVERKYSIPNCIALTKWETDELLFYDRETGEVKSINLITEELKYPFKGIKDQYGKPVTVAFAYALKIDDNRYILTAPNEGIYIYNKAAGSIYNYRHEITDPASLSNNNASTTAVGQKGWVFINCTINGISYFNANDIIGNQSVFMDSRGSWYDGYIAGIDTKDNDTYYIGTIKGMVEWKRSTNTANFIDYKGQDGNPLFKNKEITSIEIDDNDNIWATVQGDGLVVIDKNKKIIKHFRNEPGNKHSLKQKGVSRIKQGPDGYMWICGRNGICRINTRTFGIDNFENTALQWFDSLLVTPLFIDKNNLWIATSTKGLYQYNFSTKQVTGYSGFNKYKGEGIFDMRTDSAGTLYVGNTRGVKIFFKDGREKTITQKDGLIINRAEGFLLDDHNRMWIGNDIGLTCYNPADSSLKVFDERYGLSIYGFRVGSYFQTPNGEFIFGTPKGVQFFHPDSLYNKKISLNVLISKIETKNIVSNITENAEFKLAAKDNQVTFHFGIVDFSPHLRTFYEYKLVDLDKDWIKLADQNSVRYNSLPPGTYTFKVRISNDNKTWQDAGNEVTVIIATPFYQTWWFKIIGILLGFGLIWYVLKYYQRKQIKQREELETELVINYFASQINRHQHADEMLWDIAKNCISQLNFEDCVIYILDEERNVLVQKAAHGPKMERDFTIYNPIEIPVGKGIVGTVAQTGKPALINNTDLDERYIADDTKRFSELAVPLIVDGKVIGVIDSEHSQKNFFKQKHLNILTTVAVLCATQIQRVKAEEEKQKAKIETLENKQKVAESRLQSLRLQMNPHFLFNALNSIQQMILANEEMVATRYLSKFSKLLRTILVHSDKEYVTLKEELEILSLYIDLESIRFKDSFKYKIEVDEEIDTDEIKLPTLLVQPFVENAIWHGLMHKEGERLLTVRFSEKDECIECIVEDNGIGRERSGESKLTTGQGNKHTSKGIAVSIERLNAMGNGNGHHGSLQIIDLKDENGNAKGTRVQIIFPIQNN